MLFITMSLGVTSTVRELFPGPLPQSFSRGLRWWYSSCHELFWGTHDYFVIFTMPLMFQRQGAYKLLFLRRLTENSANSICPPHPNTAPGVALVQSAHPPSYFASSCCCSFILQQERDGTSRPKTKFLMPGQRDCKHQSPIFTIFNRKKRSPSLGTGFRGK